MSNFEPHFLRHSHIISRDLNSRELDLCSWGSLFQSGKNSNPIKELDVEPCSRIEIKEYRRSKLLFAYFKSIPVPKSARS